VVLFKFQPSHRHQALFLDTKVMALKPAYGWDAGRNFIHDKNPIIHQQFGHILGDKEEDTEGLPVFQRNVIGNSCVERRIRKDKLKLDLKKTNYGDGRLLMMRFSNSGNQPSGSAARRLDS